MAPKGGQETQQRANDVAFEQANLSTASFTDRDPTQAGIQLAPAPEFEGIGHFHKGISVAQRFMTGRDGSLDAEISPAGRQMVREIFEPVVRGRDEYVVQALREKGLPFRGASHEGSLEKVREAQSKFKDNLALAA